MVAVSSSKKISTKKYTTPKVALFERLLKAEVAANHQFSFSFPTQIIWRKNSEGWQLGNEVSAVEANDNIYAYATFNQIETIQTIDLNYRKIVLDLEELNPKLLIKSLSLNNISRVINADLIGENQFRNLTGLRFNSNRSEGDISFLKLEEKANLVILVIYATGFFGIFDIGRNTKLREISFNSCNFSGEDVDYYVLRLYEEGASFTGSGKIANFANLPRASGTIGDPVESGTGQGYMTGLIDEFGWTIIQ